MWEIDMMFWCIVVGMAVGSFLFVSGFIVLYLSEVINRIFSKKV
jgi:hypothetical protein